MVMYFNQIFNCRIEDDLMGFAHIILSLKNKKL